MDALQRTNWVDLLALILILRISYVGSFLGIAKQFLPLLSVLFTLTFSLYYYDKIAIYITERSTLSNSVTEFSVLIIIIVILLIITRIVNRFISFKRPEALVPIERAGGAILGLLRAIVTTGLIFAILFLMPVAGVGESVKGSMSGNFIMKLNLDFYTNIINALRKEKITTLGMLAQLAKEKDCEFRLFGFELKEKARFFKEEKY